MAITYEQAIQALKAADAAGNVEDAKKIAQIAAKLKANPDNVARGTSQNTGIPGYDQNWAANEMSGGERVLSGIGKTLTDLGRGAGQMVGMVSDEDVQNSRERDSALMDTPGGKLGSAIGGIVPLAATALIPGANTYTGAGVIGSLYGALQPTTEDESRLANTAIGGGLGVAGQYGANKLASALKNMKAGKVAEQSRNSLKDTVLDQSQQAGYVVPKSEVSPTWLSNRMEGVAGKAALKQDATIRNQEVTNSLARKIVGLADDQPITKDAIKAYQNTVSEPYRQVAALSDDAAKALEKLKEVRSEAQSYWTHYNRSADPASLKMAKDLSAKAESLENVIDDIARALDAPDLLQNLRESRKLLAQSFDVQRALNTTTGDIDAKVLARMLDKGKPLSDELKTVAQFSKAFPKFSGSAASTPAPGVGKTEALAAALLAGTGLSYMGPEGALMGALALTSAPTRNLMLSKAFQSAMVKPNYSTNILAKLLMGGGGQTLAKSVPPAMIGVSQ